MDAETRATLFLQKIGLAVERVATAETKKCDLRAADAQHSYLLEVKTRRGSIVGVDNPELERIYTRSSPAGRDPGETQRKLHEAAGQVRSTRSSPTEIGILWVTIPDEGYRDPMQATRVIDTFFGVERIGPLIDGHFKPCFYFGESVCFTDRDVAGMVVDAHRAFCLCINTLHPRVAEFRKTELYRAFEGVRPIVDPVRYESDGRGFVADCTIPRRDTGGVLEYVKQKYDLGPYVINLVMQEHSSVVAYRVEDE